MLNYTFFFYLDVIHDNNFNMECCMFCQEFSLREVYLDNVSWSTTDVHNLLRCLFPTQELHLMQVRKTCPLSNSVLPNTHDSTINIHQIQIQASLTISTLLSLLSPIEVTELFFADSCRVVDIEGYTHHFNRVSPAIDSK